MSSDISSLSEGKNRDQAILVKTRNIVRAVTPDSNAEEEVRLPEVTVTCAKCKNPVPVQCLQAHRAYHNALSTMEYSSKKLPKTGALLLKRRNALAQKLKKEIAKSATASSQLQKIDEAYDLLKSYLEDMHCERSIGKSKIDLDCHTVGLSSTSPCVTSVGICWCENSRWKPSMEDTRVFQDYFGNDVSKCFFAIYDGHNGKFAADMAANDLHHYLLKEMSKFDPLTNCTCAVNLAEMNDLSNYPVDRARPVVRKDSIRHILHAESVNILQQIMHTCSDHVENLKMEEAAVARRLKSRDPYSEKMSQAFRRAFTMMDRVLSFGVDEKSRVRWSGCSALACIVKSSDADGDSGEDTRMQGTQTGPQDNIKGEESKVEDGLTELGTIYIANAGTAHAVLSRGGQIHQLTRDHSPANSAEKQRLLRAGVAIHAGGSKGKANGVLEATRGLGNHGDPALKSAILCEPYTMSAKIDQYAEFLILATNGLWEVVTFEEAVEIIQQVIHNEENTDCMKSTAEKQPPQNSDDLSEFDGQVISHVNINADEDTSVSGYGGQVTFRGPTESLEGYKTSWRRDDDIISQNTDFESMISALLENDDGDEADIETLTEMHTIYAKSQLLEKPSEEERLRLLAEKASKRLVQAAIMAGARDNITVMVVLLPGFNAGAG